MPTDLFRALLVALLVIPLAAAIAAGLLGPRRGPAIRWLSLAATLVTLALALIVAVGFAYLRAHSTEPHDGTFRPEFVPGASPDNPHATTWNMLQAGGGTIQFYLGLDGLNVWLVLLSALLMVSAVLVSWTAITERVNEYYAWLLALGTAMTGVFLAFDVVLFYVFFELTLVPLFFLIGIWGGPQRRYAAVKFFIYTLTGSLITLLGVLAIVLVVHNADGQPLSFALPDLVTRARAIEPATQRWVFLALMAGFAIKVPLVPLHTWLPLAHVEAPTAGSVLLAGVLLKIGAYGFLRLCLPLVPDASVTLGVPLVGTLAVIGIIYGAFCALAQDDIKRLVAYSSVSHLGFCMLGIFALNPTGINGGLLQMINHGLSTGALFLLVGMLYERYHTRKIADYGGMAVRLRVMGFFWVFICLTSVALPGLNGFVGEALVLMGAYQMQWDEWRSPLFAIFAASGIILGAWYLFTLLRRVFFGPVREPAHEGHGPVRDLNVRELAALLPIAAACVFLGVYPQPVLNAMRDDVARVSAIAENARQAQPPQPVTTTGPGGVFAGTERGQTR
jgi:NADH-quinone oxidoreductase subunit M